MTRIGLFSDSHRDEASLAALLRQMGRVDAACFMGDVASDAEALRALLYEMPGRPPLYAVRGNNDYATSLPESIVCTIGGKRFYITHGHLCRGLFGLMLRAREKEADVALFGHTHEAFCSEESGVLLVNPGSAGNYCRGGRARASLMTIDGDKISVTDVLLPR